MIDLHIQHAVHVRRDNNDNVAFLNFIDTNIDYRTMMSTKVLHTYRQKAASHRSIFNSISIGPQVIRCRSNKNL